MPGVQETLAVSNIYSIVPAVHTMTMTCDLQKPLQQSLAATQHSIYTLFILLDLYIYYINIIIYICTCYYIYNTPAHKHTPARVHKRQAPRS